MHAHTNKTNSNALSPEEVEIKYRDEGYHFIALTDKSPDISELTDEGKGVERILHIKNSIQYEANSYTADPDSKNQNRHIIGLGLTGRRHGGDVQEAVNFIVTQGGLAIAAHPNFHWNNSENLSWDHDQEYGLDHSHGNDDLKTVKGLTRLEIYNAIVENQQGEIIDRWDHLLAENIRLWGFATDDSRLGVKNTFNKGWIMVNTPLSYEEYKDEIKSHTTPGNKCEFIQESILKNIRGWEFLCGQGSGYI